MKVAKFIIGLAVAMTLTACSSRKTVLPYFTDLPAEGSIPAGDFTVRIVPDDELLINVSAADPEVVQDYTVPYQHPRLRDFNDVNGNLESQMLQRRSQNLTYQTYHVGLDGFINFPVLGKIHVAGMSLEGLASYLTEKISEKVVDPIVSVELVNFHVNVMGEVLKPGVQFVNRERYSILDAIAAAGDMTPYGERKRVLIIREEDGQRTYHYLNLNDSKVLESPYFYLRQNDVVYVEPNKIRSANASTDQERQFRLSMTSVIVSAASVVATLVIALFIRK
ncbi:MAG: polysaccharide biosynthesis/export family protein [Muribaculaceae bacterium]|nr:polysaccharide biosynthesis/export family protein [Muribaculaceae bacterium]MDE6367061.1 polysaccharide biosynthesis/export family protein [Muribaculaceae bacterium]